MRATLVALILGEIAFVAFVLWLASVFVRDRSRQRAELQARVVERFGSAQELLAFLATDAGRGLARTLLGHGDGQTRQILLAVQAGIVLVAGAVGLGLAGHRLDDHDLVAWAFAGAATGAGLLVAAAVARRLSRRWLAQDAADR